MISVEQIRAARAMMDWTQDILARESGLSLATIHNLEKGHLSLRSSRDIQRTFESKGFEFFGTSGLIRRTDKNRTYEGPHASEAFYEDMLSTIKEKQGEIVAVYKTPEIFARSLGIHDFSNLKRLSDLAQFGKIRCLFSEMHKSSLYLPEIEARAALQWLPHVWSTFTCGDKHAIVLTKNGKDFTYFVMRSTDIVQADFSEFSGHWATALALPGRYETPANNAAIEKTR